MGQPRARFLESQIGRPHHSPLRVLFVLALLGIGLQPGDLSAQVAWERKSSESGDLAVPNGGDQQTCCVALDVDNDGIADFVVGERSKTPSVVWYKFNGKGWDRFVIDDTRLQPEAGGTACDVDGDGDLDLIPGPGLQRLGHLVVGKPVPTFRPSLEAARDQELRRPAAPRPIGRRLRRRRPRGSPLLEPES